MNKKGMLLPNQVVKIVIALISLSFLLFLLGSFFFASDDLEDQKKAENFVLGGRESIKTFIAKNLSKGDTDFFNPNVPSGWRLYSFTGDEKPTKCEKKSCLCVCEDVWLYGQIDQCNDNGACLIVENLKKEDIEIKLSVTSPKTIIFEELNNEIRVRA